GNDDVTRGKATDRIKSAGQLGRQRDQSKRVHREYSLEGFAARFEIEPEMRPEAKRRDERTLEMHPEDGGRVGGVIAARIFKGTGDRPVDMCGLFNCRGDGGRHPGSDAFKRKGAAESGECVWRRVH